MLSTQAKPQDIIRFIVLAIDGRRDTKKVLIAIEVRQPNGSWQAQEPIWLIENSHIAVQGNIDNNAGSLLL